MSVGTPESGNPFEPENLRLAETPVPSIKATRRPSKRQREGYVSAFPVRILPVIMKAKASRALGLVLAIHRQLHMTKRASTPLNGAIWDVIGRPSKPERNSLLKLLATIPEVICLSTDPAFGSHYRVSKGPLWTAAESSDDQPTNADA